jgi:DNA (cytosine-5)-methyltransferase 1
MMGIRVVDLFAGGGGLSLGFTQAGFDVVAAIENWKPAVAVYEANFTDHPVINLDLANEYQAANVIGGYQPNMIMGGPPCQDFSSAGKRDESQGRASLTISFANLISRCKPRFFLMENVARAATSETFKAALAVFKSAGYGLTIKVLDAAYCGAPQLRKRLIVVGSLDERDGFLDAALDQGLSPEPMTLRKYFRNRLPFEHYYRHPRSYARRGVFSVDEPSPTIRGVNRPIPRGYPGHEGDTVAITESLRCLTTQERARIQTFPASFKLPGTKTDVEQVLGNAVPVKLAEYVAKHLAAYIEQLEVPCQLGVTYTNQLFEPRKRFAAKPSRPMQSASQ